MKIRFYDAAVCRPVKSGSYLAIDKNGYTDFVAFSTKHGKWGTYDFQDAEDVNGTMYDEGGAHEIKAWAKIDGKAILARLGMEVRE